MHWANFGLLAGTALIAVPIVLHLVMRQQPKHLEFPALRFLRLRRQSNQRRLKLRHLLLLALRAGAICLLAVALARPSIRGVGFLGGEEAPVAAVLVIDTTPRMLYRYQNQTRIESVQQTAQWLLTQFPRDSEVCIIDCQTRAPAFAIDLSTARQQLDRLRVTPLARTMPEMLEDAIIALRQRRQERIGSEPLREEIYLFTDRTRSAWQSDAGERLRRELDESSEVPLYVIDVGVEDAQNFALVNPRLSRPLITQRSPFTVSAELLRAGPDDARSVELFLTDEQGQPTKRGQQTLEWSADETRQVEFRLRGLDAGTHQGYMQIIGEDSLPWDNVRYFTVDVRPPWPVLVVSQNAEHAHYLTEALSPLAFRQSGQSRFRCDVVDVKNLSGEQLGPYAAVFLLNPGALADSVWNQLADYASAGGSVAVFLGRNAGLDTHNSEAAERLLGVRLKRQSRSESHLAPQDLNHPLLLAFQSIETAIPWQAFPVLTYWQIAPSGEGLAQIIAYANGDAALVERPLGRGRVLTMTTPVSDPVQFSGPEPWNYLRTNPDIDPWPFIMLMNEMALYMVGSRDERFNYVAGEAAVLHSTGEALPPEVSLTIPSGEQSTRPVKNNAIVIQTTEQAGNYRVRAGGRQRGLDRGFSVNIDSRLSQLDRQDDAELTELLGEDRFQLARKREEIDRVVNVGRSGKPLFPYLIALVAIVLGLEHVLANRFYRRAE